MLAAHPFTMDRAFVIHVRCGADRDSCDTILNECEQALFIVWLSAQISPLRECPRVAVSVQRDTVSNVSERAQCVCNGDGS